MVRVVAERDGFQELESQHRERVGERSGIGDPDVGPTQVGSHLEVVPLAVEPCGGLDAARSLTRVAGEGAAHHERSLPVRQRMECGVSGVRAHDRVVAFERMRDVAPLGDDRATHQRSGPVTDRPDCSRGAFQPEVERVRGFRRVVSVPQCTQLVRVLDAGRFDAVGVDGGGEHRLANDRVVDEEEQIGSRSIEFVSRDAPGLGLEVVPGRGPVPAEAFGIQGAEPFDDRALHRVVQSQPLRRGLHEGQPAQNLERLVRRARRPTWPRARRG